MGLRLDSGKGITGQKTVSPNSCPNPRSDPLSGWQGRRLKHNPCPIQSRPSGSKADRQWLTMLPQRQVPSLL